MATSKQLHQVQCPKVESIRDVEAGTTCTEVAEEGAAQECVLYTGPNHSLHATRQAVSMLYQRLHRAGLYRECIHYQ